MRLPNITLKIFKLKFQKKILLSLEYLVQSPFRSLFVFFMTGFLIVNLSFSIWLAQQTNYRIKMKALSEIKDYQNEIISDVKNADEAFHVPKVLTHTIKPRETFYSILESFGIDNAEAVKFIKQSKKVFNFSRIMRGHELTYQISKNNLEYLRYTISEDSFVEVTKSDSGDYSAQLTSVKYDRFLVTKDFTVTSSLYEALGSVGLPDTMIVDLVNIFAFDIDFSRDLQKGDRGAIVIEEFRGPDNRVKYGDILSAKMNVGKRVYNATYYEDKQYAGYFDDKGYSLQKAFLRSPVPFSRISSGYTNRRFHPTLKKYRPHRAIDYAAPQGTKVMTVGNGVVTYAGWKGVSGKVVTVKHKNGYSSSYAHLHRIPKSINVGTRVTQGDLIGYVGSTGRSTGPHCHFVFKRYGKAINPTKTSYMVKYQLKDESMNQFKALAQSYSKELDSAILQIASNVSVSDGNGRF